jgi:hypothetical protein
MWRNGSAAFFYALGGFAWLYELRDIQRAGHVWAGKVV